jgi:hypothetical protein
MRDLREIVTRNDQAAVRAKVHTLLDATAGDVFDLRAFTTGLSAIAAEHPTLTDFALRIVREEA